MPGIAERVAWPHGSEEQGHSAILSNCRTYRYALFRVWDPDRPLTMFVGLNPSTADELTDDPTIRRCVGFARRWGAGGLIMANLYAYRCTDPNELPVDQAIAAGPDNDEYLHLLRDRAGTVVAAWGAHRRTVAQAAHCMDLLGGLSVLGLTRDGHPRHPLYVRGDTVLQRWSWA